MKLYCCGIGGIGLSAYASLMKQAGHTVVGSDANKTALTESLEQFGIQVYYNQDGSAIDETVDALIYSEAIPADGPERSKAQALGIVQKSYFKALGEMSKDHFVIGVCGTHGKSSTTAMAAQVLTEAQLDPSIVVGTKVPFLEGRNWRAGMGEIFLVEACEYKQSFLHLSPNVILLLNADGDHFDAYPSQADYEQAYSDFLALLPDDGVIITHMSDAICNALATASSKQIIDADSFPLLPLQVIGEHMQRNAQLVQGLSKVLPTLSLSQTQASLQTHVGCWRRLEHKGISRTGATVIDDYGHHPVEIAANISALISAYPNKNIHLVFQPHTHLRTLELYQEFIHCFVGVHTLYIPNIYDARSFTSEKKVDVADFVQDIAKANAFTVRYTESLENTYETLQKTTTPDDVVVCMGAGDITNLATRLTK